MGLHDEGILSNLLKLASANGSASADVELSRRTAL